MVNIENKNVFISCACTYPKDMTIFPAATRFAQLLETIKSCEHIDDHINIIAEASELSESEKNSIKENAILFEFYNDEDVKNASFNKQLGSIMLWIKLLNNITFESDDTNVFFLSGRYVLNESFKLENYHGDFVYKNHWYDTHRGGWYGTQLFMIKSSQKDVFIKMLQESILKISNGEAQDIECALYQALSLYAVTELEEVGCNGLLGIAGINSYH